MNQGGSDRDRSQSVDRAIDILLTIARHGPLRISDLAALLELPRRNLARLITSLESTDLVQRDRKTRGYDLGTTLAWLGEIADRRSAITSLGEPVIRDLMNDSQLTALLYVLRSNFLVRALMSVPPERVSVNIPTTDQIPLTLGVGRTILASMSDAQLAALEKRYGYSVDPQRLSLIRERGYEVSQGEIVEGIYALGAPVFDTSGDPLGVVVVVGVSEDVYNHISVVKGAASALTQMVGKGPPN